MALLPVLVSQKDIEGLRTEGKRIHGGFEAVHNAARKELNHWADTGAGADQPGPVDFPLQSYVAMHRQAKEFVGPGITAFELAFIEGTRDSNRDGNHASVSSFDTRTEDIGGSTQDQKRGMTLRQSISILPTRAVFESLLHNGLCWSTTAASLTQMQRQFLKQTASAGDTRGRCWRTCL